jgi:hypothetical protein
VRLFLLGAAGALGSLCVLLGVLRPGSPFVAQGASSWFWTSPAVPAGRPESSAQFLGIMLVYLGLVLLLAAWFETIRATRTAGARIELRHLLLMLVAWAAPILLAPPLFSRDVYSYAAQGQMVASGLNPYLHGPSILGRGPFLTLVDPLWRHATAPYGPAWERLSGWVVQLSGHRVEWAVVGFRLVAVIGLALVAWGVPALARACGRDGTMAFAVAVLNPLVLLVLPGGAHNDALMLGLLVLGCVQAARRHPLAGLACCALAAEVKAPALLAVLFIGWAWWGQGQAQRQRLAKTLLAVCFTLAVMAAIGAAVDLSWRWVGALLGAGTVVSWLDPVTAIGLALAHLAHAAGYHGGNGGFVRATRALGLAVAAAITIRVLLRPPGPGPGPGASPGQEHASPGQEHASPGQEHASPGQEHASPGQEQEHEHEQDPVRALGWSIFAFVLLGPVIWPWYYAWAFVFLAIVADGWTLRVIAVLSAIACFATMPTPRLLTSAPTPALITGWLLLGALAFAYAITAYKNSRSRKTNTPGTR